MNPKSNFISFLKKLNSVKKSVHGMKRTKQKMYFSSGEYFMTQEKIFVYSVITFTTIGRCLSVFGCPTNDLQNRYGIQNSKERIWKMFLLSGVHSVLSILV
jgi:hypothetical protein